MKCGAHNPSTLTVSRSCLTEVDRDIRQSTQQIDSMAAKITVLRSTGLGLFVAYYCFFVVMIDILVSAHQDIAMRIQRVSGQD